MLGKLQYQKYIATLYLMFVSLAFSLTFSALKCMVCRKEQSKVTQ